MPVRVAANGNFREAITKSSVVGHELGMGLRIRSTSITLSVFGVLVGGCVALTAPGGTPEVEPTPDDASAEADPDLGEPAGHDGSSGEMPIDSGLVVDGGSSGDSGPDDGGGEIGDATTDGATVDSGAPSGVTCTYRRWLTHTPLCDEKCPGLPPDETQVVTNVPLTVFSDTAYGGICRSNPIGGRRRLQVHVPNYFIAMTNNEARFTFQLAGAPPLETTRIYSTNCVAGLDTSMGGKITVINGNEATVDFYADSSPWFGSVCDFYAIRHACVRVRIECKGSDIAAPK